jgi:hypothetical protein
MIRVQQGNKKAAPLAKFLLIVCVGSFTYDRRGGKNCLKVDIATGPTWLTDK